MKNILKNATLIISLATASYATAEEHQHDSHIQLSISNQKINTNSQLFEAQFDSFLYFTDTPGIHSELEVFNPAETIGFNINTPLKKWNGLDFDTLNTASNNTLAISYTLGQNTLIAYSSDTAAEGFQLNPSTNGQFHKHYNYTLLAANHQPTTPNDGIFLLELQFFSSNVNIEKSLPIYILFNLNKSEESHALAADYVTQNLIPEPTSLLLLATPLLLSLKRKR